MSDQERKDIVKHFIGQPNSNFPANASVRSPHQDRRRLIMDRNDELGVRVLSYSDKEFDRLVDDMARHDVERGRRDTMGSRRFNRFSGREVR